MDSTEPRHATQVDPAIKQSVQNRLRRIEGQVRGLQKMVEEERYCADVLTQVSSVQEALRGVGKELLENHLRRCTTAAACVRTYCASRHTRATTSRYDCPPP